MVTIYVDILLVINLAVDYLVLFGTARLAGAEFIRIRGFAGAVLGAIYSLVILLDFSKTVFAVTKFAVSVLMVVITFGKRKIKELFRILIIFYICGFLFSGFMMLINSVTQTNSFFIKGGIVYFEFSALEIVLSGTAAFIVTEILQSLFTRGEPEGTFFAKVVCFGKTAVLNGFTDTGNNLSEPISGTPVAVTSPKSFGKIIPKKMLSEIESMNLSTEFKLRLVPCKTVSGSMLIPAFRPEKVIISNENGEFEAENIMVAFSKNVPENTLIIGKNVVLKEKIFSEV